MAKTILISILFLGFQGFSSQAQEINFEKYADYGIGFGTTENLNFNDVVNPIVADGSTYEVGIQDAAIVQIHAVKYLDVYIHVNGDETLTNGTDHIDFTLKVAYNNQEGNNTSIANTHYFAVNNNNQLTKRIPVLARNLAPPNPPPTPPTNATDITNTDPNTNPIFETINLFLFGDLVNVDDVSADTYTGNITIEVRYDL